MESLSQIAIALAHPEIAPLIESYPISITRVTKLTQERLSSKKPGRIRPHHIKRLGFIDKELREVCPQLISDSGTINLDNNNLPQVLSVISLGLYQNLHEMQTTSREIPLASHTYAEDLLGIENHFNKDFITKLLKSQASALLFLLSQEELHLSANQDEICDTCAIGTHCRIQPTVDYNTDTMTMSNLYLLDELNQTGQISQATPQLFNLINSYNNLTAGLKITNAGNEQFDVARLSATIPLSLATNLRFYGFNCSPENYLCHPRLTKELQKLGLNEEQMQIIASQQKFFASERILG